MFDTIVVGTDGSEGAAVAVASAIELVRLSGGALHIVSVGKPIPLGGAGGDPLSATMIPVIPDDALKEELEEILQPAAAAARAANVDVHTHAMLGAPAEVLVAVAEELSADVLVVGNRGMQGARRFLGSVPNSVVHHAPCTVLLVETVHHTKAEGDS